MQRREFIRLLSGAAAWPLAAHAQQPSDARSVGSLAVLRLIFMQIVLRVFRQGLNETGYVEGRNVAIEFRWADGRLRSTAGTWWPLHVRRQVDGNRRSWHDLRGTCRPKPQTATIPIVFSAGGDPVQLGLVASLNRPGGNLTGMTVWNVELVPKRLELIREWSPRPTNMAPYSPTQPTQQVADD